MNVAPVLVQTMLGSIEGASIMANTIQEDVVAWGFVLDSIKVFATLVKDISQIHPYAHAALTVLSVIPQVINDQLKTDQRLRDLVSAMQRAYGFIGKTTPLEHIQLHVEFFENMARATFECGNFIREYVNSGSFVARAIKGIVSPKAKTQLENHMKTLASLMDQFKEDSAIHTEISVVRTLETTQSISGAVDELTAKSYLDDMRYAEGAGCVPEKRCLEGTRIRLLDSISGDLHGAITEKSQGSERILLLTGVAGSGKSAVAHEIAHRFKSLHRLGASFCFSASHQAERSVDRFLSTIARSFAEVDSGWRNALVETIKSDKDLRTTRSPRQQLEEFILKPAQKLQFVGPIIVVIDALDEVADEERKPLLDCLSRLATDTTLPDNIRFFITSRPDPTILNVLYGKAHIQHMDILSANAEGDIHRFIEHELLATPLDAEEDTIRSEWVPYLVEQAENSFQWAYTSCEFIKSDIPGLSAEERYLMLRTQQYRGLESLYEAIMNKVITAGNVLKDEAFELELREKLCRVLGLIVTAYEPLPWSAWVDLLGGNSEDVKTAGKILPYLGPLFRGVSVSDRENNRSIQPAHTSLRDYLTEGARNQRFRVDTLAAHVKLVNACLRTMETQLRFNICGLETSHRANKDVLDLPQRIQQNISPALLYGCRFWNSHLTAAPHKQFPLDALFSFLKQRLLFWLEAMSLLRMVGFASEGIKEVRKWILTSNYDTDEQLRQLEKMLGEADQFVSMCIPAISISTPHLYLSALAYVPSTSFISRCYSDVYAGGVRVINKEDIRWPDCILCVVSTNAICAVAVSPDGRILATAHYDCTVKLWNAVTGEHVGESFVGHTDFVRSVVFSPDGKIIASGSDDMTVCLWNASTGKQIGNDLCGHTSPVLSVAFSPDQQTLVSGSSDKTVRLWKVTSRESASEALIGHTGYVSSVAFSPCGRTFASGSHDERVRVWNAETRVLMYAPLEGHTDAVKSIAFSPDSQTLASCAEDKTIRLWDVETGQLKYSPLVGHLDGVISVAFSPDGGTIASGSRDHTIRLWTADTGKPVGSPLRGHTYAVRSVAFSSDKRILVSAADDLNVRVWKIEAEKAKRNGMVDGNHSFQAVAFSSDNETAASASGDGTVHLWNTRTGQPVGEPLRGHTNWARSVVFSPDGRTIASGSDGMTLRLWNVKTGQLVCQPLEGHSGWVRSVAFSPDGKIVASCSDDETIRLWDAATGEQLGEPMTGHTDVVRSITFSPDGQCLASGSYDRTIILWDVTTRQRIGEPLRGHEDRVNVVAFSPDRRTIASGSSDALILLWHVDTREPIGAPLLGHTGYVFSVAFSPDGKTLVSGSNDHTIRLWDVATLAPLGGPLRGHTKWVNSVAFYPGGAAIISGSEDRTVRLWGVPVIDSALPAHPSSRETSLPPPPSLEQSNTITTLLSTPATAAIRDNESSSRTPVRTNHTLNTDSLELDNVSGYMLGPEDELLFWVPPDYRIGLCRTSTLWVAGALSLRLDLSHFVHGERWMQCRTGRAA
ncbi:WD40 repeat-like protein [Trametopsis cervina]|nr:WD40 repeat-like protein [Trametopsis cervina]